jgi:hypothetical protein
MTIDETVDGATSIVDEMERLQQAAHDQALAAMDGLREVALRYTQRQIAEELAKARQNLTNDEFRVIIMGLFSHGKSTLLNALLADRTHPVELHGHKGPMLTGLFPTTAVLTSIRYSEKPYVFARRYDGTSEEWTLSRYLDEAKLEDDGLRQQAERLLEIQEFGMGYPARICGSGVAIFDSPGLNDGSLHDKITGDELRRADAAVMLFNTRALLAMNETLVAEQLTDTDTPLFYVVNVIDDEDLPTRPELERYVWNRLVHKALRGPEYTDGVRLADRNVYLVDARKALNGRVRGDAAMVAGSGIVEFEQVLLGFLANDIAAAHMRKHVTSAQTATGALRHRLEERAENANLERDQAAARYRELEPKIGGLLARPALLRQGVDTAEAALRRELANSLQVLVMNTKDGLGDHMSTVELTAESKRMTAVFYKRQLQEEAGAAASAYVTDRVAEWASQSGELGRILRGCADRLSTDLEIQAGIIETTIAEIKQELGFRAAELPAGPGPLAQAVGAIVGAIVLGPIGAIAGAGLGVRAVGGGLAGAMGAGAVLSVIGVSTVVFVPVVIGTAIVVALWSSSGGLGLRVKSKIVAATEPKFAELHQRLQQSLDSTVTEVFTTLRTEVEHTLVGHIEAEIRNIEDTIELTQRSEQERLREIATIRADVTALDQRHSELEDAVSKASMGEARPGQHHR